MNWSIGSRKRKDLDPRNTSKLESVNHNYGLNMGYRE
jgi:hypothetical protein